MVCCVPEESEVIAEIPIPILKSELNLSKVSLVMEFLVSLITTFPIKLDSAKHLLEFGLEFGLSLSKAG
jgi:hypothetical protein